jgi:pyridinium-3,5-bisthiocarboxylic acid mononucleotide nickel chelatase
MCNGPDPPAADNMTIEHVQPRIAWIHCFNGVAGDMLLGALLDAGADETYVRSAIETLGVDGWSLQVQPTQRCGIAAVHAVVRTDDQSHHRPHREVRRIIECAAGLDANVAARASATFAELAAAEGAVHGVDAEDVEFHEVGSLDAIVDVVGVCAALEALAISSVSASPIAVGTGTMNAAHGLLPNPGPAVTELLARRGAPAIGVDVPMELTTPTGAALITTLAGSFGALPPMQLESVGYGAGTRDLAGRPNVVQVVVGVPTTAGELTMPGQPVQLLEANVDDATGEVLAATIAALLGAGAHDAWITPIVMKKGRPAHTIHALCDHALASAVAKVLVRESGTLGLRGTTLERWPQRRTELHVEVGGHLVRVKHGAERYKVEHDDAAAAAKALSWTLRDVMHVAEVEARRADRPPGS